MNSVSTGDADCRAGASDADTLARGTDRIALSTPDGVGGGAELMEGSPVCVATGASDGRGINGPSSSDAVTTSGVTSSALGAGPGGESCL